MFSRKIALTALAVFGCGSPTQPAATPADTPPVASSEPAPETTTTPEAAPVATDTAETQESAPAEPKKTEEAPGTPEQKLMRAHFSESEEIRQAIIDGNISATSKPAQALGNMKSLGKAKPGWKPAMSALQKAAQRFGQSPDLPSAAAAVADIGVACGRCHRSSNAVKLEIGSPPAEGKTIESRMKRHAWASNRLWEGLYAPSDAAWEAGAKALTGDPFPKDVLKKGGVHARSAAATFKSLVGEAAAKRAPGDRAQLYASLLETCSACHMATRGK
jgi:hypothetical protein